MAEVLTESFCERCGTRYTFESAQPRVKRLKGVKVLSRGLKNFVLSDDSSLDEAMAAARSDTDREITSQQLDAFHQTFNFCMTCRQYTCANCWNEAQGACLTCEPHLGQEILPAPFPDLDPKGGLVPLDAVDAANGNGNGHDHATSNGNGVAAGAMGLGAWPASDLATPEAETSSLDVIDDVEPIDAAARLAALTAIDPTEPSADPTAGLIGASDPDALPVEAVADVVDDDAAAADAIAASARVDAPALATDTDEVAAVAAAQTAALLHRFRPGQNLDAEIEAYEREQAALEARAVETVARRPRSRSRSRQPPSRARSTTRRRPMRSRRRPTSPPPPRPTSPRLTPNDWRLPRPLPPSRPSGPTSSSSRRGRSSPPTTSRRRSRRHR